MSQNQEKPENNQIVETQASELNELVAMIVDYYCFKNNVSEDHEEDEEGEEWKKKSAEKKEPVEIVPAKLDNLIEMAFARQLKRFTIE